MLPSIHQGREHYVWGFSTKKPPVQPGVGKEYFSKRKRKPPVIRLMWPDKHT